MKAIRIQKLGGPEGLRLDDLPEPTPGPGEVLVRVRRGVAELPRPDGRQGVSTTRRSRCRPSRCPTAPARCRRSAPGVTRFKPGDRVAAASCRAGSTAARPRRRPRRRWAAAVDGMLAETRRPARARAWSRIPEHLSFEEAATLPCAAVTAWHALVTAGQLKAGRHGAGPGDRRRLAVRPPVRPAAGARVIATSSSDEKLSGRGTLGRLGRDQLQDDARLGQAVRELTGGEGVDHVVEVGGAGTLAGRSGRSGRAARSA